MRKMMIVISENELNNLLADAYEKNMMPQAIKRRLVEVSSFVAVSGGPSVPVVIEKDRETEVGQVTPMEAGLRAGKNL